MMGEWSKKQILRESENTYRTIVDSIGEAVLIMDSESLEIVDANSKAALMFQIPLDKLRGIHLFGSQKVQPSYPDLTFERLAMLALLGKPQQFEWLMARPDGSSFWSEINLRTATLCGQSRLLATIRQIDERKAAHRELKESKQRLKLVLDTIPARVFWKDRDLTYLGCNRLFAQDAGLSCPDEVIGKTDEDLVWRPEESKLIRSWDRLVIKQKRPQPRIVEPQTRADGRQAWIEVSRVPLTNEHGEVVGILGTYEDITERRRTEVELAQRNVDLIAVNEELERLHKVKDEFVATISHELRSPLVTGMGYLELLLKGSLGSLSDEAHNKMTIALRSLKRLAGFIDDLLSYHRLSVSSERYEPRLAAVDLHKTVGECVDEFLIATGFQASMVRVRLEPDLPPVLADVDLLRGVFSNLLSNAARHGGRNVSITVSAGRIESGRVRLSVSDNGVGMSEEMQKVAFDLFVTSNRSLSGSTGLGLAIVKAILVSHQSEPVLESAPGQGTKIWFELACA